ncbi:hypothetical protein KIN20_005057 [Parelaphostrongylus tenuis]|uniref:TMC domain-containing protein n=1 Tax=Parelaphostrongylus tenuis TaxID=148309 RepID=A0AAD5QIC3_PARTN|nr:hypothetical protein KIN20_005057 [Parelaphostrongylus tenuis]
MSSEWQRNARMSKLSGSKAEQYIFNWRVFTGWDYTIGNQETASNTVMAIVIKLRESIADCRVSEESKFRCLQFTLRVPSVVATITHVFPMIFDLIGRLENYHPRTALRAHLTRVLVLYVLNYLTLIVALFDKMDAIRKKEPHDGSSSVKKRQLGGRNPNLPRPPPYASRTFENRADLLRFIESSTKRFDQNSTTKDTSTTPFTVMSQYGPVNVNNPNAILRNGTLKKKFEAKRIGPNPLPIYTPPPRTFPPYEPGRVIEKFGGPDHRSTPAHQKPTTTSRPRVTRPPPTRKLLADDETTEESDPSSDVVPSSNATDLTGNMDYLQSNETIRVPPAAERKSVADEVFNTEICWETIIGQEIVKLVTMDLIVTIVSILLIDFLRGLWIKYCSSWWCWDIETTFPEYGEFKVAENVLHIINNQGMIWLGLFFTPLLPALNNIKLIIIMYIRGWAVMTCNVPAREVFRVSRSSNFYLLILLLWLLLCTLPVGFVIASTRPSRKCGPFAQHDHFYTVITKEIEKRVDPFLLGYIRHVASPGVVIPIYYFSCELIIYFLVSLVRGLREANTDLQQQLIHERTEEKKKIFELAGGKKKVDQERDRDPRKSVPYLPLVEQQRREPWRPYTETQRGTHLAEDSSESEDEDMGESSSSPTIVHRLPPVPSSTSETVAALHFHRSLGSLVEKDGEEEEDEEQNGLSPSTSQRITLSVSQQFPASAIPIQASFHSEICDVSDNTVDVPTPEEVRLITSQRLRSSEDMHAEVHRLPTTKNIEEEDERRRQSEVPTKASGIKTPIRKNGSDSRSGTKDIHSEFQPWPSIVDVNLKREQLLKSTPLPFYQSHIHKTDASPQQPQSGSSTKLSNVHHHRKYTQETSPIVSSTDDERRSASPSRRFRISVSPTRKPVIDTTMSGNVRRFMIKQESMNSSKSSVHHATEPGVSASTPLRAPCAHFDEDDSPRAPS